MDSCGTDEGGVAQGKGILDISKIGNAQLDLNAHNVAIHERQVWG